MFGPKSPLSGLKSPLRSASRKVPSPISISDLTVKIEKLLLNEPKQQHSDQMWRSDAEKLLKGLKKISGRDDHHHQEQQSIKQLCTDIDSAVAEAPASGILTKSKKGADLKELVLRLESIVAEKEAGLKKNPANQDGVFQALHKEGDSHHVVCICGESGMGKTTLAKKVFHRFEDEEYFKSLVWVPVNQQRDFQTKPLLQAILMQLLPAEMKAEIRGMDEIQLSQRIFKAMKEKKSLVVLEDMMDEEDWKSIRVAFPITGEPHSKVLITTPSSQVAESAATDGGVFEMKPWSEDECLKIILEEDTAFEKSELNGVGKTIWKLSGGRPLFVIILRKYLKAADFAAREKLLEDLSRIRISEGEETKVLEICYNRLPHQLKSCLLYMGLFPEGQDIEVEKLSLLLEAEGLILEGDSVRNMLEQLDLKGLIDVQEDKLSIKGMYKSCRLHDQIRDFCISQALGENFFKIAEVKDEKNIIGPSTTRLVVYLSNSEDGNIVDISFSTSDTARNIRSLLVFDTYESQHKSTWPSDINGRREFISLRVLDYDGVDFRVQKLSRKIDKLAFLRHLSFRGCWLEALPSSISSLTMLETLDLRVTMDCKIMTLSNHVFSNMIKLRHLYFPTQYESDDVRNKLRLKGLKKLETLVNFQTDVCEVQDLLELTNLKILAIISEGSPDDLEAIMKCLDAINNLQQHYSSLNIQNFDCYTTKAATTIEMLLTSKSLHSLRIEGQIGKLSEKEDLSVPPNFTEMEFNGSELEDDPMNALGKAENLRSLVLSNDAFVGSKMSFSDASKFPELRVLRLLNLQYVEELTFEGGAIMPKLTTLVIDKCDQLKKVEMPKELDYRLRKAQREKGDDVYSVEPPPKISGGN